MSKKTGKEPYFNSRPSARGDATGADRLSNQADFNSRPSARGDLEPVDSHKSFYISIHAPPRGATYDDGTRVLKSYRFQFTPLREGRQLRLNQYCGWFEFQFTPLREGRRLCLPHCVEAPTFQFTPLREGRQQKPGTDLCGAYDFNSRPSARGDLTRKAHGIAYRDFNSRPSARGDVSRRSSGASISHFNSRPSARGD